MDCAKHCQFMMYLILLFILGVWASTQASSRLLDEQYMLERHKQWMAHHGRVYKDAEEMERRFKVFKDNMEHIEAFNAGMDRGYKLSVNQFADLTNEEFQASHNGYNGQSLQVMSTSKPTSFRYANYSDVPSTVDWREKGAVTSVKTQRDCGCCWAFSAVGAMEGITRLKTGKLVSLSNQQLVDCVVGGESHGCQGGLMTKAFQYIMQNNGLTTEDNYPYMAVDSSTCDQNKAALVAATITGYEEVPSNSENALLQAVANHPVSVGIDGSGQNFQFYSSGVFTGPCGARMTHAVTAVGYGTTTDGTKYWLLKNSWGTGWGESGYIKVQRDVADMGGLCGVAKMASYPTA